MKDRREWAVIPHFEGHEVSTRGEIRNIASGKILQTSVNQSGVRYASLRNTTTMQYSNMGLAQLIAAAFCPGQTDNYSTVLHLDGDTDNLNASNLMWATRFHAMGYHREIREDRYNIIKKRIQDESGRIYRTIGDAARATGCLPSQIDYAVRYNDTLKSNENMNFVHRTWPGHVFKSA